MGIQKQKLFLYFRLLMPISLNTMIQFLTLHLINSEYSNQWGAQFEFWTMRSHGTPKLPLFGYSVKWRLFRDQV